MVDKQPYHDHIICIITQIGHVTVGALNGSNSNYDVPVPRLKVVDLNAKDAHICDVFLLFEVTKATSISRSAHRPLQTLAALRSNTSMLFFYVAARPKKI